MSHSDAIGGGQKESKFLKHIMMNHTLEAGHVCGCAGVYFLERMQGNHFWDVDLDKDHETMMTFQLN